VSGESIGRNPGGFEQIVLFSREGLAESFDAHRSGGFADQVPGCFHRDRLANWCQSMPEAIADHSRPAITRANDVALQHFLLMIRHVRVIQKRPPSYD
jgi:hypothetical protein